MRFHLPSASTVADTATIFCAMLSVINAFSLIHTMPAQLLSGVFKSATESIISDLGWNSTDVLNGIAAAPGHFRRAQDSVLNAQVLMGLARVNVAYFGAVLPAFSLWGFATVVKSVETIGAKALIYTGGATLGAAAALAASSFAFAAGMFVNASISGYAWYRATQPDAPYTMLEGKIHEYDELEKEMLMLNAEIAALQNKKSVREDEIKSDVEELEQLKKVRAHLTAKKIEVKEDIEALYACALSKEKSEDQSSDRSSEMENLSNKPADPIISHENKVEIEKKVIRVLGQPIATEIKTSTAEKNSERINRGENLIQKQIKDKRFETIANIIGGVGAVLGGLAILLPPAAIPLFVGCAVCFAVCAVMKGIQWFERREAAKQLKGENPSSSLTTEQIGPRCMNQ